MTKSIKRLRLHTSSCSFSGILFTFTFTYVILACTSVAFSSPPSCGLYGAPPCQFLPAPPGQTPNCARPGKTYCEHVDNYPTYLIKSLVRKWGYEAATLLVDETWEEFTSITSVFYDPKYIFPQRDFGSAQDFNGYNYQTPFGGVPHRGPGNSLFAPSNPSSESPTYLLYTSAGQRQGNQQSMTGTQTGPSTQLFYNNAGRTPYNATLWLKRLARDLSLKQKAIQATTEQLEQAIAERELAKQQLAEQQQEIKEREQKEQQEQQEQQQQRQTRDVSLNMDLLDIVGVGSDNSNDSKQQQIKTQRNKRQSPTRSTLCETTSQFITPQAALNSRGNWMFVVNEENTARQMVKAELCASNTCSNLCDLPNGYNSRCEQKFVQKRLIALQGNGQNLYTDTFWFPSCCVCTIAAN